MVSTCNRVECYVYGEALEEARAASSSPAPPTPTGHLYEHSGREAVRHLFRVAASLDSMVVGEPQILGQVKEAYGLAAPVEHRRRLRLAPLQPRLRDRQAGPQRDRASPGAPPASSQVAVELVEKIFGNLKGRAVLLVGAGKMGALSAKALRDARAPTGSS